MRVLVAGASGVVGTYLLPQLLERGHDVIGTATRREGVERIRRTGATAVLLDGLDATAVREVVARTKPEAIVNEMTALKGTPDFKRFDQWFAKTNELRTKGTANLLAAAAAVGTPSRLIVQSYTGWTNDASAETTATEDEPFDPDPLPQQRNTLAAIQTMEKKVLEAPIEGVVLRYASLYAPESMGESVRLLRKRQFPLIGNGAGVWSWLHGRDAAGATVAALEKARRGVYNVADDDPAPVSEWLPHLAELVGAPMPMRIPAWLAKLVAGDVAVRMMTRVRGVSNARIKRELGWRPVYATWRDGFRTIAHAGARGELVKAVR